MAEALGLVAGTVPATPLKYSVSLAPGQYAQLDDVVVTQRVLPGRGDIQIAGVVTNVEAMHEGARFASDVFLIEQGALPAEVCEVAEVTVTRVEPEMYVPPLPGAAVTRAAGSAARLGPVLRRDGLVQGAGRVRPGRAAGLRQLRVRRRDPRRARVDLGGVRDRDQDLVRHVPAALDHPLRCARGRGAQHQGADLQREERGACCSWTTPTAGSRPPSGSSTRRWGCPRTRSAMSVCSRRRGGTTRPAPGMSARDRAVSPFYWTLAEFCEQELLPFVFADAEDERAQYTMLIGQVAARLRRDIIPAGQDGAIRIGGVNPDNDKILRSFGDLVTLLEAELGDDSTRASWVAGSAVTGERQRLVAPAALGGAAPFRDRPR